MPCVYLRMHFHGVVDHENTTEFLKILALVSLMIISVIFILLSREIDGQLRRCA